jgi:nitrate reductase beta subunit
MAQTHQSPHLKYNPETDRAEKVIICYYEETMYGPVLVSSTGPGRYYRCGVTYASMEDYVASQPAGAQPR